MGTWQLKTQSRKIFVSEVQLKTVGMGGAGREICFQTGLSVLGNSRRASTRHKLHSLTFTSQLVLRAKHLICFVNYRL